MKIKSQFQVSLILTLLFVFILSSSGIADEDYYQRLKKGWGYMRQVYEQLNKHYVEEVDPYPLIKAGINGMLDKLDPYTQFIEEDAERRLQLITTGKYGGLGMEIGLRNKQITVISPIDNSPAKRMGIFAGDVLKKIDGFSVEVFSISEVSERLRGKIGTTVKLEFMRPGIEDHFELTLMREEIVIKDVGYSGFVSPGVAYLNLSGFTEKAAAEAKLAIKNLQSQGQINSFILDLRGNPGGLLKAAVDVVNIFVPKGELVVYTKGFREGEVKFKTSQFPILPEVPLVVLVDGGSASASEIVAGALQDMDRAVIIGEATFGKGLVQKVYPINEQLDAKLKITTAKYYVPSGRCIQKQDYGIKNEIFYRDTSDIGDDQDSKFFTRNQREVYDRGGIYPDIPVEQDSISLTVIDLLRKSYIFDFAVAYHQKNPQWQKPFEVDNTLIEEFKLFLKDRSYEASTVMDKEIRKLDRIIKTEGYSKDIQNMLSQLKEQVHMERQIVFENNLGHIRELLKLELAEKYFNKDTREKIALENDPQAIEALKVLQNQTEYKDILAIN